MAGKRLGLGAEIGIKQGAGDSLPHFALVDLQRFRHLQQGVGGKGHRRLPALAVPVVQ